jgi:hypothetical protein
MILAALAAFKENIYQKHVCPRIFLPHHYKKLTPHELFLRPKIDYISPNTKQNSKWLWPVNQVPGGID